MVARVDRSVALRCVEYFLVIASPMSGHLDRSSNMAALSAPLNGARSIDHLRSQQNDVLGLAMANRDLRRRGSAALEFGVIPVDDELGAVAPVPIGAQRDLSR